MKFYFKMLLFTSVIALSLSGCFDIITAVSGIPDAENSVTADGRLFVSAYNGVYEIIKSGNGYGKQIVIGTGDNSTGPLLDIEAGINRYLGDGDFLGMAAYNSTIFMVYNSGDMTDKCIVTFDLNTGQKQIMYNLKKTTFPNGMAFDNKGRLYIADQIALSLKLGRIMRITVDHAATRVWSSSDEEIWQDCGLTAPNGLIYDYNKGCLVVTDICKVKEIYIRNDAEGSAASVTTIYQRALHFLDDLVQVDDGYIIADFFKNTVFMIDYCGDVVFETDSGDIKGPSSVSLGMDTDIFDDDAVIVTSKGILFDRYSNIGNKLVYFIVP